MKIIYYKLIDTKIDKMLLASTHDGLCRIGLPGCTERALEEIFKDFPDYIFWDELKKGERSFVNKMVQRQLELYFAKKLFQFSVPLDVKKGTDFQRRVWRELTTIPYGETRSYKDIAIAIDKPKAFRAVGNANNKNPIPIIIPCHRVIHSNGDLKGYAGGIELKRFLLALEASFIPSHTK